MKACRLDFLLPLPAVAALMVAVGFPSQAAAEVGPELAPLAVESSPSLTFLAAGGGDEVVEGRPADILWEWTGDIATVALTASYDLCKLGGEDRGSRELDIAGPLPNTGYCTWEPPWLDTPGVVLRLTGYDAAGSEVASAERYVSLRPRQARDLTGTFILILLDHQRLYFYQDDKLTRMHIVSTARRGYVTPQMEPGHRFGRTKVGEVFYKDVDAYSHKYDSPMPYWMAISSSGSYGIHAATPGAYSHLGHPASHGCVRQHLLDARVLYELVPIGTPVYIY